MHICPQEIMAVVALGTAGTGAIIWLRWKWKQLLGAAAAVGIMASSMFGRR